MDILLTCLMIVYIAANIVALLHLLFRVVDDSDVTIIYALAPMLDIFKDVENFIVKWMLIFTYTIVMIPALLGWYASAALVFLSRLLGFLLRLIFRDVWTED